MRVLIVGSGGREHALAWGVSRSPRLTKLYAYPGNAGIARIAKEREWQIEHLRKLLEDV